MWSAGWSAQRLIAARDRSLTRRVPQVCRRCPHTLRWTFPLPFATVTLRRMQAVTNEAVSYRFSGRTFTAQEVALIREVVEVTRHVDVFLYGNRIQGEEPVA